MKLLKVNGERLAKAANPVTLLLLAFGRTWDTRIIVPGTLIKQLGVWDL
jgi:hypothetical protein